MKRTTLTLTSLGDLAAVRPAKPTPAPAKAKPPPATTPRLVKRTTDWERLETLLHG